MSPSLDNSNLNKFLQFSPKLADLYLKTFYDDFLNTEILNFHPYIKKSNLLSLLKLLAINIDHTLSAYSLSTQINLNSRTIRKYLNLLISAKIIFELKYFDLKQNAPRSQKSKFFFLDPNLLNLLLKNSTKNELATATRINNLFLSALNFAPTDSKLFYTTFHSHLSFLIQTQTSKTLISDLT